jgi:hypothetical protein
VDRFSLFPDIAADRSARDPPRRSYRADRYGLAKTQGKPKLAKALPGSERQTFSFIVGACAVRRVYRAFIANLKLTFNPADHDPPNTPVNRVGT